MTGIEDARNRSAILAYSFDLRQRPWGADKYIPHVAHEIHFPGGMAADGPLGNVPGLVSGLAAHWRLGHFWFPGPARGQ